MNDSLAVVVAAGLGSRLLPLTEQLPKCMLEVQDRPLLHWALDIFHGSNIPRSVVIGGYKADRLILPEQTELVMNHDYMNNNILHSLACARSHMETADTVLVSYSDIVFRRGVVKQLMANQAADISIVVDQSWAQRYVGRKQHPLSEAEGAYFDNQSQMREIGKGILKENQDPQHWGEFIGMLKFTRRGQDLFWSAFDSVQATLSPESPFQQAAQWRRAYITDLLKELVDKREQVHCTLIQGGWLEIDTEEDYETALGFDFAQGEA